MTTAIPSTFQEYRLTNKTNILADLELFTVDSSTLKLSAKDVLVKIHAASLNYRELLIVADRYGLPLKKNLVPLSDGAGEVIAIGADVTEFKVGDRVMGNCNQEHLDGPRTRANTVTGLGNSLDGVLTQYRVFPQHGLVHMPSHLSYEEASTLPCAAVTAWNALFGGSKPPQRGETVLIQGTGGVSIFGLQFAAAVGAKTIVTSSSDAKLELAKKLGATYTINYRTTPDWGKEALKLTNGEGVDHILEVGGQDTIAKSLECIKLEGVISAIGFLSSAETQQQSSGSLSGEQLMGQILWRSAQIRGIGIGSRRLFQEMNKALELHQIKPVVDRVFSFEQAKEAYQYLQSQQFFGKIVIKIQ